MLKLAFNNVYDTAILVSADADFAPVIEAVKELGKHVENAAFEKRKSWELHKASDLFISLNKLITEDMFIS